MDGAGNPNKPLLISYPQHEAFLKGEIGISFPSPLNLLPRPQCHEPLVPIALGEEGSKQVTAGEWASPGCQGLVDPTGDPCGLG